MSHFENRRRERSAVAEVVKAVLTQGKSLGVTHFRVGRTTGSKGQVRVKILRDGNGGLLVSTNEPGTKQEFWVATQDPQDTMARLGHHLVSQGLAVAYR